jgi:hypothetical protein
LGSGFSKSAGLPLGTEIFQHIQNEAKRSILYENILKHDIKRFLDFNRLAKGIAIEESDVELEQFISFLDIEHYLKLVGKDHWSDSGNQSQLAIKNIIARILYRDRSQIENLDLYEAFGRSLLPGDVIITFNYDTLIETILDGIGSSYVFSVDEYNRDRHNKDRKKPILILKLHGSLDWYSILPYKRSLAFAMEQPGRFWEYNHPIFSHSHELKINRVFPYLDDKNSSLANIYRIDDVRKLQTGTPSVTESPYIVSPSHSKIIYLNEIIDLWFGLNNWGNHCSSLTIIGFSLPIHDEYLRQVIYNIVENYLDQEDLNGIYTKPAIRIVDKICTENDLKKLKERYPFIDFGSAVLFKDGFGRDAILAEEFLNSIEI